MRTKTFLLFSLLICNLLPAQNVKLDIKPRFLGIRADSFLVAMDISVEIEEMSSKNAVVLTPVLTGQEREVALPSIHLNGKQKQRLYLRNQILRKKADRQENGTTYLAEGIDENYSRTLNYRATVPAEDWMSEASLVLRRTVVSPKGERSAEDTVMMKQQSEPVAAAHEKPVAVQRNQIRYKGAYVSPATDDMDIRNQKELNFNLEEAKIMAEINPQMLSLRELYTVALSYAEERAKFYQIITTCVKLYPVHPVANLNAAAAAIEQGDTKAAGKFLSIALHEGLAYKNCRGVYELMTGNTYEGIRILKAAKAEGSEEASYNLNIFFESNKRP